MKKNEADEGRWARLRARRRWNADDARWMIEAWTASGVTMVAFASSRGIDGKRLMRWRARLGGQRTSPRPRPAVPPARAAALVPVSVRMNPPPLAGDDGGSSVVVTTGGVRVEIRDRHATSPEWVARLLGSLRTEVRS